MILNWTSERGNYFFDIVPIDADSLDYFTIRRVFIKVDIDTVDTVLRQNDAAPAVVFRKGQPEKNDKQEGKHDHGRYRPDADCTLSDNITLRKPLSEP